ncbi:hypothetical protein [uncultured Ferrimonas sp.]|uniref:hypothetical protein n=1 Tax=uncultured Ferrimonas sp. TaxID=432640 RepID=UPI0026310948|nr:hypothetical protein [uncultured Ferrimonas sp.]
MKLVLALTLTMTSFTATASYLGGSNYYQAALQAQQQQPTTVLAQADSAEALQRQFEVDPSQDINTLLARSPTAAGNPIRIVEKVVVDKCYSSWQALACSTKVVYQIVE